MLMKDIQKVGKIGQDKFFAILKKHDLLTERKKSYTRTTNSYSKNNYLCDLVFGGNKNKLTKSQQKRYYSNNGEALKAFQARKTKGMNLSDRVWNLAQQFRSEVESGIDLVVRETFRDRIEQKLTFGIGEGKSANVIKLRGKKSH
jgi:hypothetical protein